MDPCIAFFIAFTSITAAHLVIGEQTPKIFALRRPEIVALWGAIPLKIFFYLTYPLMAALNAIIIETASVKPSGPNQTISGSALNHVICRLA